MMCTRFFLAALTLAAFGCDKSENASATSTAAPTTKKVVEKELAAAGDGPDCPTFLAEVKAACRDHYAKGLDVNCQTFLTQVNVAIEQGNGELFVADQPAAAAKAGARMCAMMGKRLRTKVAAAASTPTGPKCQALGQKLDQYCFAKIGTKDFPRGCSGIILATTRFNDKAETTCELQGGIAGASIFK